MLAIDLRAVRKAATTPPRVVLGVERSLTGRRWVERLDGRGEALAAEMAGGCAIPDLLARVLAGRGVAPADAADFLDPTLRRLLPDPSTITDMDEAAVRIVKAIIAGEKVAIFGDYDVDGATSAALLARFLRSQKLDPEIYIPDRLFEGYGPNREAVEGLARRGATLIVTVDCGTTSVDALARAAELGVDVIVVDHHLPGPVLPPAIAVVNPNRDDDLSGLGHLSAVGVVFMLLVALNRALRIRGRYDHAHPEPDLLQWLDLVALGTVCDVVGLAGLNRAFVAKGLLGLRRMGNAGIAALTVASRLDGPVSAHHLGFLLGPRINAGGRIGNAALGARLLTTDDPEEAASIAAELDRLNAERQAIEARMLDEAVAIAEPVFSAEPAPPLIVTHNPAWHPGVVGLIASRLKERYGRPALALAIDVNGVGVGSGRSIPGVDLGRAIRDAVGARLLLKGGGHAMAAGVTVDIGRLADLERFLSDRLGPDVAIAAAAERTLSIDGLLTAAGATVDLIESLDRAGPFGAGHPAPMIVLPQHQVTYAEAVGNGHVRISIGNGAGGGLKGMAFRAAGTPLGDRLLARDGKPLHLAGTLSADHWQGKARPSLRVVDASEAG